MLHHFHLSVIVVRSLDRSSHSAHNARLFSCSSICLFSSLLLYLVSAGVGVISLCQKSNCFLGLGRSGNGVTHPTPAPMKVKVWSCLSSSLGVASFVSAAPLLSSAYSVLQVNSPPCCLWHSLFAAAVLFLECAFFPGSLLLSSSPVSISYFSEILSSV